MSITVYHGGTDAIPKPRANAGRSNLDFGQGFYLTNIRQQAYEWAKRVSIRRNLQPLLNIYELDRESIITNYRFKIFTKYDGAWLDFIVNSRLGNDNWKIYDYIESGVANDRVIDSINLYMANLITREKALERLSEHQPNNQMCILSQEIIDNHLFFYGTEQL